MSNSMLFSTIVTFISKKKSSMNFPQNASKPEKGIVWQYVAQFVEKNSFVNIYPLLQV